MGLNTRRLITGPLLVLATAGAGLAVAPSAAVAAGVSATVSVRSTLKVRAAPSLAAKVVGSLHNGQRVVAVCSVTGQTVRGSVRTTGAWNRLSSGGYVTDAYVSSARRIPGCAATSLQAVKVRAKPPAAKVAYKVGTVRSGDGSVNVRSGPSTSAPARRTVADGAKVQGVCGVVGTMVSGTVRTTTQWNRLSDGGYISHAYVVTPTLHLCPDAPATPPVTKPSITSAQFLAAAMPGAQRGWREYGVPASVTIAQAILESGWGRSSLAATDRNYFGIKCQKGYHGKLANGCHVYRTSECTKEGKCFVTTGSFRTYASMAHSFRDHGSFLRANSRYKPAFGYPKDANKFIWQVWKAGYATDPNYYTKITGLMTSYNLYQYDTWK